MGVEATTLIDLRLGDCRDVLSTLPEMSIDAVVCDPPYDLTANKKGGSGAASINLDSPYGRSRIGTGNGQGGFMGKQWDGTGVAFQVATWEAVLRVMKPGAYLLAFGGTRTYHRMTCAIEDAGFEIRDCLQWIFGSGFPKSHNLGNGWGTALKPAYEPIVLARKPLEGTTAANVAKWGCGALHIDMCRISTTDALGGGMVSMGRPKVSEGWDRPWMHDLQVTERKKDEAAAKVAHAERLGRWPANVILSHTEDCQQIGTRQIQSNGHYPAERGHGGLGTNGHGGQVGLTEQYTTGESVGVWKCAEGCAVAELDRQSGQSASRASMRGVGLTGSPVYGVGQQGYDTLRGHDDSGGASRFFYVAKASRADREFGLERFAVAKVNDGRTTPIDNAYQRGETERKNTHPTVKPTELMRYLCRLVTPPGGLILDPFMGSGSTGVAAMVEGFRFVGIEQDAEYLAIARTRIEAAAAKPVQHGFDLEPAS